MKKRDKGKNAQQQKQEEIHLKNCYLKRIKAMMEILGDESAYDLLGPKAAEFLYRNRLHPLKLVIAEDSVLSAPKKDIILMNEILTRLLRDSFVSIGPENKQINLCDYFCYPETILLFWLNVDKAKCLNAEAFKNKFLIFHDFDSVRLEAHQQKENCIRLIPILFTRLGSFSIRVEFDKSLSNQKLTYNNYLFYIEKPETELSNKNNIMSYFVVYMR